MRLNLPTGRQATAGATGPEHLYYTKNAPWRGRFCVKIIAGLFLVAPLEEQIVESCKTD